MPLWAFHFPSCSALVVWHESRQRGHTSESAQPTGLACWYDLMHESRQPHHGSTPPLGDGSGSHAGRPSPDTAEQDHRLGGINNRSVA